MNVRQTKIFEAAEVPVGGVFQCSGTREPRPISYMRLDVTRISRGELSIAGHIRAVCLETAVIVVLDGNEPVVVYSQAKLELGAPDIEAAEQPRVS